MTKTHYANPARYNLKEKKMEICRDSYSTFIKAIRLEKGKNQNHKKIHQSESNQVPGH